VNIVGVEQGLDMVMMFINAIDAVSTKTITANVPLVGDGWGQKSQLFELAKIITSTNN
jgi:hypothetical protein